MGFELDVVLAVVCALGLAVAGWWLLGMLLRPMPGDMARLVLPGRGEGEKLEQQVRACMWLRGLGLLSCPVIIADVDLSPRGWELALRLTARWPGVLLWPAAELPGYFSEFT